MINKIKTLLIGLGAFLVSTPAFAADSTTQSFAAIGAAIVMGLAAIGGTFGQGKAVAAALEGIARNPGSQPKVQPPMILGLALIESLVLFSFVIAIILALK